MRLAQKIATAIFIVYYIIYLQTFLMELNTEYQSCPNLPSMQVFESLRKILKVFKSEEREEVVFVFFCCNLLWVCIWKLSAVPVYKGHKPSITDQYNT